jgi:hypothetical protein
MTALDESEQSTAPAPESFDELAARVDELRARVSHHDEHARSLLEETLDAVAAFNRAGLVELVRVLRADPRGEELLFDAVDRPEVMALLVSHEIVRVDRTMDVLRVVDQLRPHLAAASVQLEVVRVEGDSAVVSFGTGCNAPAENVKAEILTVLTSRLSGMSLVEEVRSSETFVPLTSLRVGPP